MPTEELGQVLITDGGKDRLIVMVHGYKGHADKTWGHFPAFLAGSDRLNDYDILLVGYPTGLAPDISGVWAADPDLASLANFLATLATEKYKHSNLVFVAHSMGGLVVQRAVADGVFGERVRGVFCFGTPSGGLRKAKLGRLFKRQVRDMHPEGAFITKLRSSWNAQYGSTTPFAFRAVAGLRDEFVPRPSNHGPFGNDPAICKTIEGNHLEIVKPRTAGASAVTMSVDWITGSADDHQAAPESVKDLALEHLAKGDGDVASIEAAVRLAAFELEATGQLDAAVALLENIPIESPEMKGMLAGRQKRIWLAAPDGADDVALAALDGYRAGYDLAVASKPPDLGGAYYNGINVAFMLLAYEEDAAAARGVAEGLLALLDQHEPAKLRDQKWRRATRGEVYLHLNRVDEAVVEYEAALSLGADDRERRSMAQQAIWVSRLLELDGVDRQLATVFDVELSPDG